MVESLIKFLSEAKAEYQFKGLDFEADLITLYNEIRVKMAQLYDNGDFGPASPTEMTAGLSMEDVAKMKACIAAERKLIKTGYDRIKQKIKDVRQDYRKAVTLGRRSGSGKLVCDNWDQLKIIWGGSPATISIANSTCSLDEENDGLDFDDDETSLDEDGDNEVKDNEEAELAVVAKEKINPTAKFVDNKRKMLEKSLSASQRDQVYLNLAKDELRLKQNMVDGLTEATKESNKAFEKISESIASVGKSIGDGFAALANALSGMQQQNYPHQSHFQYQNMNYGPQSAPHFNMGIPYDKSSSHSSTSSYSISPQTPNTSVEYSNEHKTYQNL